MVTLRTCSCGDLRRNLMKMAARHYVTYNDGVKWWTLNINSVKCFNTNNRSLLFWFMFTPCKVNIHGILILRMKNIHCRLVSRGLVEGQANKLYDPRIVWMVLKLFKLPRITHTKFLFFFEQNIHFFILRRFPYLNVRMI